MASPAPSYRQPWVPSIRMPYMRWGSLILTLFLLGATGVAGYVTIQRVKTSRELVLHTYQVRGRLKDLRADIGESHANFDLYQLSRNPNEAVELEEQTAEQSRILKELFQLTKDNSTQFQRLSAFRPILEEDFAQLRACVAGAKCMEPGNSER